MGDLKGKRALVCGGTHGIGAAAADAVARVLAGEEMRQSVIYVPTQLVTAANADQ